MTEETVQVIDAIRDSIEDIAGLEVLFLFGSRARGDAHDGSDWDFAYLGSPTMDVEGLLARMVLACGTDRVDIVDLSRSGGLLRYRVARDGHTIFERSAGTADRFRVEAADFWCDAGPRLEREYETILSNLHS